MRYVAVVGEQKYTAQIEQNGHTRQVTLNDREFSIDVRRIGDPLARVDGEHAAQYSILIGDHSYDAYARIVEGEGDSETGDRAIEVYISGRPYRVMVQDERTQMLARLAGAGHVSGDAVIRAPMPGLVANVLVEEQAEVTRGQTVVVLEAMKMENDLAAPRAGWVKSVRVTKGQTVNQGDILAIVGDNAEVEQNAEDDDIEG